MYSQEWKEKKNISAESHVNLTLYGQRYVIISLWYGHHLLWTENWIQDLPAGES